MVGLRPLGATRSDAPSGVRRTGIRARGAIAVFRRADGRLLLALGTQVGVIAHLFNRGVEIVTPLEASFAVSVLATLAVLGRFLGGAVIGRVSIKAFALINGRRPTARISC